MHIFKRGSVTAIRYRDEVLEPIVRLYAAAVGPTFVLIDDNAHPHRADIVDDYLASERIARMAWRAYSPDLNPIENLWDAFGRAVSSRFPPLATLIELETALQEEWQLLNSAVVDHLIESIVRSSPNWSLAYPTGLAPPHFLNPSPQGSQLGGVTVHPTQQPIREQLLSSKPRQKLLKIYHPEEAQKPRLPDPIVQPIAVMPLSRT
ncbi:transposable element Tcb1 transposase [Trichonephila clavipes]|nr:transposable element Tcb1 transposase [Trichonephila clavipes]